MNTEFTDTKTEKLYTFRGKTFLANPRTIKTLNYAISLNRAKERYVLADTKDKKNER